MKPAILVFAAATLSSAQLENLPTKTHVEGTIIEGVESLHNGFRCIKNAKVSVKTAVDFASTVTDSSGNFSLDVATDVTGILSHKSKLNSGSIQIRDQQISINGIDTKSITINDLRGRVLHRQDLSPNQSSATIPNFADGTRILTITTRSGETQSIQWSGDLNFSFGAESSTENRSNSLSVRSEISKEELPDTMTVQAPGYPLLKIAGHLNSEGNFKNIPHHISIIDSSRGSAKNIKIDTVDYATGSCFTIDTVQTESYHSIPNISYPNSSVLLSAPHFYTTIRNNDNPIQVDLDSIVDYQTSISGSIILTEIFYEKSIMPPHDTFIKSKVLCTGSHMRISLMSADSSKVIATTVSDGETGRYQFKNIPEGTYVIRLNEFSDRPRAIQTINTKDSRERDLIGEFYNIAVAPNIYLYPESTSKVSVNVNIRENGKIPFSIPTYGNGWNVTATPEGKINDSLGFLYYDFISPIAYQSDSGWVLSYKNFDSEVTALLSYRGLNKQEILDFLDFWKKYIPVCDWVTLCPTDANKMVELSVNPTPTTLFRELYLVKPSTGEKPTIKEPSLGTPFIRKGFTVVEWGGHLDGLDLNKVIADKTKK